MESSIYEMLPMPGLLADLILVLHAGIVFFVVLGQVLFMIGGLLDWVWVRRFWIRLTHLLLILVVVLQAWLGALCPLTIWEHELRRAAGQTPHDQGFVEYWLGQLIYHDLPSEVFVVLYTTFALLVIFTWWWIPPRRSYRSGCSE
ncbi:hypothetical protein J2T60_002651 [Natronospira proteinivora]|uniref:DUF2784 domain-containing protein n=1 Tax=Natronospira proteinivora TaxID=1807133 RepID=A0ABT1GC61_9GAMM|nr:DUF2784 domain-containing protein [Natronospira proteinivora]MCP1728637.1 hypothetical protein [Natronospira proteinivora]